VRIPFPEDHLGEVAVADSQSPSRDGPSNEANLASKRGSHFTTPTGEPLPEHLLPPLHAKAPGQDEILVASAFRLVFASWHRIVYLSSLSATDFCGCSGCPG
jgi:hypothetical protein